MSTRIQMPAFSATMETAKLISWLVVEGENIEQGQVLAEIETDKSVAELESPVSGRVVHLLVPEGDDDIGVEVPLIEIDDGSPDTTIDTSGHDSEQTGSGESDYSHTALAGAPKTKRSRVAAAPSARRAAQETGVNLKEVAGTGPNGRITKQDVLAHKGAPGPSESTTANSSSLRSAVARAMVASKTTVPHFYTETEVIIDRLLDEQSALRENGQGIRVTLTALLISCVAKALSEVDDAKFRWEGDGVVRKDSCDIGIAVDVGNGVIAPVIRNADELDVLQIAVRLGELASEAKSGTLSQADLGDASLTISNLGMFSIDRFFPIINIPEPLVIGIGRSRKACVVVDDQTTVRSVLTVTLSVDHRVIDGAVAGRFADALQREIEGDSA